MLQSLIRFFSCTVFLLIVPVFGHATVLTTDVTRLGNPNAANDAVFGTSAAGIGHHASFGIVFVGIVVGAMRTTGFVSGGGGAGAGFSCFSRSVRGESASTAC